MRRVVANVHQLAFSKLFLLPNNFGANGLAIYRVWHEHRLAGVPSDAFAAECHIMNREFDNAHKAAEAPSINNQSPEKLQYPISKLVGVTQAQLKTWRLAILWSLGDRNLVLSIE